MSNKYTSPEHIISSILSSNKSLSEGKLSKFLLKDLEKGAETVTKDADKLDLNLPPIAPSGNLPAVVKPSGAAKVEAPASNAPTGNLPSTVNKTEAPTPAPVAAEPTVKPEVNNKTLPATNTKTATETKTINEPSTKTATETKTINEPSTKTDTANLPAVKPNTATKVDPKTKNKINPPKPPKGGLPLRMGAAIPSFWGSGVTPGQSHVIDTGSAFGVGDYLHKARARSGDLDARVVREEKREDIVNVPRPNSNREKTMTKNQEIKNKILDENSKKKEIIKGAVKEYSVKLNPEYKSEKLSESMWSDAGRAINSTLDKINPFLQGKRDPKTGQIVYPDQKTEDEYSYGAKDLTADVASLAPGYGAAPSLYSAKRDLNRGDYGNALLDTIGAVPMLGWLGKAGKAASVTDKVIKGAKVLNVPASALQISSAGKDINDAANQLVDTGQAKSKSDALLAVGGNMKDNLADEGKKAIDYWKKGGPLASQ